MPAKNCVYCSKPLPKTLRADARYCPGPKCRVYAHRRRVLLGQKPAKKKPVPLQLFRFGIQGDVTRQLLTKLQSQRRKAKLPPLIRDVHLQAEAESEAYRKMSDRIWNLESEVRSRMYGSWRPRFVRKEEQTVRLTDVIKLPSDTTHLGIHTIPRELGGGVVIITAKSLD